MAAYFDDPNHRTQWRAFCRRVERPELAKSLPQVAAEIMLNSRPYCFS